MSRNDAWSDVKSLAEFVICAQMVVLNTTLTLTSIIVLKNYSIFVKYYAELVKLRAKIQGIEICQIELTREHLQSPTVTFA